MALLQLNQVIALEKGVKERAAVARASAAAQLAQDTRLSGITRVYQPRDDEGEKLPSEQNQVQVTVTKVLESVRANFTRLFDVQLTKDAGNASAVADIIVDGDVLVEKVPVQHLLFLEKQLADLRALFVRVPVLPPDSRWAWSEVSRAYVSDPVQTTRTKKVPRNHVKAAATQQHPAQVEVYLEDVIVGDWTTVKLSGASTAGDLADLIDATDKLIDAVKQAREKANSTPVPDRTIGDLIFGFLMG